MTITIVKNSTTINIIEDPKWDLKNDGGFNTVEIHFYSDDEDLLDRWDRVTFNSETWRVAEVPNVKIDYETSAMWLYTVTLIESAAILQGVQMPQTTFTQDIEKTKTLQDAIETELEKQADIYVGESYTYTLKSSPSVTLTAIAPDNKFDKENLYQRMKYFAELLDAKVFLDESTNEIDFIPLNEYTSSVSPTYTSIEYSKTVDQYCTDLIEDAENCDIGVQTEYPHKQVYVRVTPKDITDTTDTPSFWTIFGSATGKFENATIILPDKIKKIHSIVIKEYYASAPGWFDTQLDYGEYIFEQTEWLSLNQESLLSSLPFVYPSTSLRENSLYYVYGKNVIENVIALMKHTHEVTADSTVVYLYVDYEPLPDTQIRRSTGLTVDGGIKYTERVNQLANTVSFEAEKTRIESELRNRQSNFYNVTFMSATLPSIRARYLVLGSYCLATQIVAQKVGDEYEVNAKLATEYNKKNILTQVISENRIFEIPSTQTVIRKMIYEKEAKIAIYSSTAGESTGDWVDYNHTLFNNFNPASGTAISPDQVMAFMEFKYKTPLDDSSEYISVAIPCFIYVDDDTIVLQMKMTSNTNVDLQRIYAGAGGMTASNAMVTDANGENESAQLKLIPIGFDTEVYNDGYSDVPLRDVYPFVDASFFLNGYFTSSSYAKNFYQICDEFYLNKDRREQLQFEFRLKISPNSNEVVNTENLLEISKLKAASLFTPKVVLTINGNDHIVSCTIAHYSTYTQFNYTVPYSGTLQTITLYNGTKFVMSSSPNISVISGNSRYFRITYKEA